METIIISEHMPVKKVAKMSSGFLYLLKAPRVILGDIKILRLAITPFLINTLLFAISIYAFNLFIWDWVTTTYFPATDVAWYWEILYWLFGGLLALVSFVMVFFGFALIGIIVAAPFNDLLSAAVEKKITGHVKESPFTLWGLAKFTIFNETRKVAVVISIQALLFLINLVPGIGQVVFVTVSPLFWAMVMGYEFTGYTLDRRGYGFTEKKKFLKSNFPVSLGFGLGVAATLMIPILNFLLLPISVTAGTMMAIDHAPSDADGANKEVYNEQK